MRKLLVRAWKTLTANKNRADKRRFLSTLPGVTTIQCRGRNDGEILVQPPEGMRLPVTVHWTGVSETQLSNDTLRARGLRPGWYSLDVEDACGLFSGTIHVKLEPRDAPIVERYEVIDASSDDMSDGSVKAICSHVGDTCTVVWSNGARTSGCTLSGVRPGTYLAWVVEVDGESVTCMHAAAAACVDVAAS